MKLLDFRIVAQRKIAQDVYLLDLVGDTSEIQAPGQFVNLHVEGQYLPRPLSICDYAEGSLRLIYKVVGKGTQRLSAYTTGDTLQILLPLGNGFDTSICGHKNLLIGGGVGVPPLVNLAKKLLQEGKSIEVLLGFNSRAEVFAEDLFAELGLPCHVTTMDGSYGKKGLVTDVLLSLDYDYIYTCGSEPMLHALSKVGVKGQFSFEARMACGFGACMGCSCKTKYGYKRICKEGPVLHKEEILW